MRTSAESCAFLYQLLPAFPWKPAPAAISVELSTYTLSSGLFPGNDRYNALLSILTMNVLSRGILLAFGLILSCLALQAQNCTVNAGVNTSVCPGGTYQLNGAFSGSFATSASWSQIAGPAVTIASPNSAVTSVTGFTPGNTYTFRYSAKCTDGSLIYDDVDYVTTSLTKANAGPDITSCPITGVKMVANAAGTGETGAWVTISANNGAAIATTSSATSNITFTNTKSGVNSFAWTITNTASKCVSADTIIVTNRGGVPTVDAGAAQTLSACYNGTTKVTLAGSYAGDITGTDPYTQQGTWTLSAGPNNPIFANTHQNNTAVTNLIAGSYLFKWTVAGGCVNGSDTVRVNVPVAAQAVTAVAGGTLTYCDSRTTALLSATAPSYADEVGTWTVKAGSNGTIETPNKPATNVNSLTPPASSSFIYTITNSKTGCSANNTYTVSFTTAPSISAPSIVQVPCGTTAVSIAYTTSGGNLTQWLLASYPSGVTGVSTAYQTAASPFVPPATLFTQPGTYRFILKRTTSSGSGGCADAYATVNVQISKDPATPNAGTNQVLACNVYATNLAGNNPTANGAYGSGTWTQVAGPNSAVIANPASNTSGISGLVNGVYTFRWIVSGGPGCNTAQKDVNVTVADKAPTTAAAGSDQDICASTPYKLTGNNYKLNETGAWTVNPSAGVTFTDNTNPVTIANGMAASTDYVFTWTINNACGTSASNVTLRTSATAGPEQSNAGPDQCLSTAVTSATLAGNAPNPSLTGETGTWSTISGPNTPTFTNNTKNNTTITGLTAGTYLLAWQLDRNGCTPSIDTVMITLSGPLTTANAGTNARLCGGSAITLSGNNPTAGTGAWTQTAGPGGITITDPTKYNSTVTGLTPGVYTFRWTISNGACPGSSAVVSDTIIASPTTANAGPDISVCNATTTTTQVLAANTITSGTGAWSVISAPAAPTFTSMSDPKATISALKMGTYVLQWASSTDPACQSMDTVIVNVVYKATLVSSATQNLCSATEATIVGTEGSSGTWALVSTAPAAPAPTQTVNANTLLLSDVTPGSTYVYSYTINAVGSCTATSVNATLVDYATDPPANAGADIDTCVAKGVLASIQLAATPAQKTGNTGTWTFTSADSKGTPTFSPNATTANAKLINVTPGTYVLTWNIKSGGNCSGTNQDVMYLKVSEQPQAASAVATQPNTCASSVLLVADTPNAGIGTWTYVSGPSNPYITAPNSPSTTLTGITATSATPYVYQWTVTNGAKCAPSSVNTQFTVSSLPVTSTVTATAGATSVCVPSVIPVTLSGSAINTGAGETSQWSIATGPGSATIAAPGSRNTTVSGFSEGSYKIVYKVSNGSCFKTDTAYITGYAQPTTATVSATQSACLYQTITLGGNTPTTGTGAWTTVTQPSGSSAPVISDTTATAPTVNGLTTGQYVFRWSISNGNCAASTADQTVNVDDCRLQVTKTAGTPVLNTTDGSYTVTFKINVNNPGSNVTINNVQVVDNLLAAFPSPKTFTLQSVTAPGVLSGQLDPAFNGNSNQNLLKAATSMAPGTSDNITIVVKVTL